MLLCIMSKSHTRKRSFEYWLKIKAAWNFIETFFSWNIFFFLTRRLLFSHREIKIGSAMCVFIREYIQWKCLGCLKCQGCVPFFFDKRCPILFCKNSEKISLRVLKLSKITDCLIQCMPSPIKKEQKACRNKSM